MQECAVHSAILLKHHRDSDDCAWRMGMTWSVLKQTGFLYFLPWNWRTVSVVNAFPDSNGLGENHQEHIVATENAEILQVQADTSVEVPESETEGTVEMH